MIVEDESNEAWMAMILGASMIADSTETEPEVFTYQDKIPVPEPTTTTLEKALAIPIDK